MPHRNGEKQEIDDISAGDGYDSLVTATSLFDLLARDLRPEHGSKSPAHLVPLAEKLIAGSLADLAQFHDYENELSLATMKDANLELELRQTVWQLLCYWAIAAEEIFERARPLSRAGATVAGIGRLNDAIGRVQARLTVKPEQIAKARQQIRDGQTIPAKELRNELNVRLRG